MDTWGPPGAVANCSTSGLEEDWETPGPWLGSPLASLSGHVRARRVGPMGSVPTSVASSGSQGHSRMGPAPGPALTTLVPLEHVSEATCSH